MKKKGIQQPFDNENSEGAAFTLNLNDQSSASVSPNEDIIELQKENSNIWKELEKLKKDIEQIENNQYENDDDVKFKLDIESTEYSEIQNEIHDMTSKLNISKSNIDSISYSIKCIKHEIKKLISNHENTKSQVSFTLEEPNQPNFDEVYEEIGNLKSRFAQDLENINKQLELIREAQNSFINASTLDLLLGNNNSESSPEILSPVFIEKLHDQVNQLITNNSDMTKSMKCINHELVKQQKFINDLKMQSLVMERSVTAIIPEDSSSEGSKEIDTRISDIEQRLIDIEKQSMNEVLDKIQNEINNIKASNDKDGVPFMMEVSDVSDKPNNFEEILDDKINDLKSEFENRCRELEEQIETFQEAQNNFVDKDAVNLLLGDNEIDEDQVRNLISTNIEQLQNEIDEVKNDPRTLKHERDVRCLKHETKKLKLKLSQQKKIAKENSGIPFKLESDSFEDSIPQLQNVIQQLKDEIEDIRTDQLQVVQNQSMQIPMNDLFQEQFEKYNKTINKLQTDMHQLKKKSNNQPTNDSTMISTAQTEIDELRDEITRMKDNLAKNGNDMPIQITMDDYTNLSTGEIDDINHDISQLRSLLNSSISETKTKLEYLENMIDQIKQNNNYSDMPLKIELNDNSDSSMNNEIMSEINDMKKTLNHLTEKVNGLQTQTLSINETIEQINNKANDEASFTPYKIEINDNDISINNEIINEMADMKKAFNDLVEKVEEIQNSTNQSIEQFNNKFNEEPSFAPYKIELNDSDSSIHETIADIQDHTQKTSNDVQDLRKTVENLLNTVNHLIDINDRNHSDVPLKIELHDSDDYERVDVNEFSNLKNMINLSSSKSNEIQKAIDEIRKDLYEIKDAQQKGVTISLENNSDYLSDDKEELIKNFINQEIANSVRNTINENNEKIYSSIKCIKFEVKKLKKNIHEIEANQALNVEERNLVLESDSDSYQNKNEQYFTDFNNKLNYITQNFDKLNEEIKELKQSKNNNVLQLELTGGDSSSSINESEHALSNKHNSLAIDNILHSIEDLNNKIINIQNDIENTNERQSNNLNLTLDVHEDNYATLDEIDSIKDYINKLQEKVENLEAEQQQLNNDKIEAIVPISNMDELFAALNDRINTLESEITNNKLSINHLKSNLSYLSPPQQEKEVRIIHQQDDGIHLIPGINDSTLAEILDRLNSFDASLNELNKLKDTISSQQAKLAEQEKFINRMNDSTSAIPINFDNPEEIENIKNDLEKMNESIDKLEKQSFATSPSSYKQKTELRLVQEYDEAGIHLIPDVNDDSISEIISHLNQLTTRVEEYEKSFKYTIENLKQEIEDNLNAHNENATFKLTDNSSSASQIDDIKENIENLKYEITDLKKHVEEIEKHPNHIQVIREMDERGIRLIPNVNDATVSELQDKVKSLEFKLSTATTPIPSTTAAETYQNPFAGDEAQIEKLHNSMKSITQTVNQQTAYIKKHKAKIGALQSSFNEAQEVIKHLKEEVEGNSQKVNLQNKYIQKHNKEISTIKNELSTLREDGMSSGSDIDNKTRSLIKKNAREIAKMKESLNIITETEAKVDEMQTELAKMKGTNFEDFDIMKMMSQNKDADVSTFVKALAEKLMNTEKMIESIQHDTKMLKKEVFPNDKMPTSQKVMVIGSPSKIKSPSIRSNQEKRKSGTVKHEPLNFD
ncbi:hypothetical protein TRFO_41626 [Tritrichomonas foetus]|uniref:Uncharacterized protein n=1 Tax=Tritrichomonas foetus TaxID=1144522 RepID=A0A1J4KZW2_9EUKA|nr:hypothetical protein TRFO_41626 [Tritrichomonas foetus]|eukprot:OHT16690.1 hypothetical protein TRFO_41626 [Tritrichomonas foetus]